MIGMMYLADGGMITDFDSMEDYRKYKVHPDHVAVGTFMRPVRITRSSVDFYID